MPKINSGKGGRTSRRRSSATEDAAPSKRGKTTGTGWNAVANKKAENEEQRANSGSLVKDFWLLDGEEANIQFLDDEPYCMDGHGVKNARGKFDFIPCQLSTQRHCLMCQEGIKATWKGAFKVLDYRGAWDKDSKEFKYDKPVEKLYKMSQTDAQKLRAFSERKKRKLTEMVITVSRTGSTAQDTSYSFERAEDEDGERLRPAKWNSETPSVEELCAPPSDADLNKRGFGSVSSDDNEEEEEDMLPKSRRRK